MNYQALIKNMPKKKLVDINESGIDRIIFKNRGWVKKREQLLDKNGKYYQKTNIIAGYVNYKSIAAIIFTGSCNIKLFENWIDQFFDKEAKTRDK